MIWYEENNRNALSVAPADLFVISTGISAGIAMLISQCGGNTPLPPP
jgi:hypothetical protein